MTEILLGAAMAGQVPGGGAAGGGHGRRAPQRGGGALGRGGRPSPKGICACSSSIKLQLVFLALSLVAFLMLLDISIVATVSDFPSPGDGLRKQGMPSDAPVNRSHAISSLLPFCRPLLESPATFTPSPTWAGTAAPTCSPTARCSLSPARSTRTSTPSLLSSPFSPFSSWALCYAAWPAPPRCRAWSPRWAGSQFSMS